MTPLIEFFIGQELETFFQGSFSMGLSMPGSMTLAILGMGLVILLYWKMPVSLSARTRWALMALRTFSTLLLLFMLLQPKLSYSNRVPQGSSLLLLVDDSQSMTIADLPGKPSRAQMLNEFLFSSNGLVPQLESDFRLLPFRFAEKAERLLPDSSLQSAGKTTSLGAALEQSLQKSGGTAPVGVLLFSDGAENSTLDPFPIAEAFKAQNIPIYTVSVGKADIEHDLELLQVRSNSTVLEGSVFEVRVSLRHYGYEGKGIEILLENEEGFSQTRTVTLGKAETVEQHVFEVEAPQTGHQVYRVQLSNLEGEQVTKNNHRSFLISNQKKPIDVLYVEGHPRHEYKFIQRAFHADPNIRLATYLQTGPQKFLRQGIQSPQELAGGFPSKASELFQYEAIILGDVSRSFFNDEQLALLKRFVDQRGGGFLMIGGTTAFDQHYADTAVADLLPIHLASPNLQRILLQKGYKGTSLSNEVFPLGMTVEGEGSLMLRLGTQGTDNRELWSKMPDLKSINLTGRPKPGTTILAVHPKLVIEGAPSPLMVTQNYGRGRTMALTTASTWRWQMLLPYDDQSHERFWRQVVRWLATQADAPLEIHLEQDSYRVGDLATVKVQAYDAVFDPLPSAEIWLKIETPSGTVQDLLLRQDPAQGGNYAGQFQISETGVYQLEASSSLGKDEALHASAGVFVNSQSPEFQNFSADPQLLSKLAERSGGQHFSLDEKEALLERLQALSNSYQVVTEKDLWDMPLIFVLLFSALTLEWILRRRKGLS